MSKFLYNNVELPALPSFDDMAYPYMFIFQNTTDRKYWLVNTTIAPYCTLVNGVELVTLAADTLAYYFTCEDGDEDWGDNGVLDLSSLGDSSGDGYAFKYYLAFIWTNETIYKSDGVSVYLAASEPVEVNEGGGGYTIDDVNEARRRGFIAGFLTGVNVRGVLKKRTITETFDPTVWPEDIPGTEEEIDDSADDFIDESGGTPIVDKKDKITFDYNGRDLTVGYLAGDDFEITYYNPVTTEFRAKGWQRGKLVSTVGGMKWYAMTDYLTEESPGGDYINKIQYCTRSKLYYNGEQIWPKTSAEPEASYYLYGTPSESGNVAIAEGDGYVVYKGGVLPKLPEWDRYSHVVVYYSLEHYYLRAYANKPTTEHYDPILPGDSYDHLVAEGDWHSAMLGDDGNWRFDDETSNDSKGSALKLDTIVWANVDITTSDNEPFMSASAPIPLASNEPVAAVYNGIKLPPLPEYDTETYPYAYIVRHNASTNSEYCYFYATKSEQKIDADGFFPSYNLIFSDDLAFEHKNGSWASIFATNYVKALWANTDVYYDEEAGGGLYLAASDPIPIYEQKE